MKLNTSGVV